MMKRIGDSGRAFLAAGLAIASLALGIEPASAAPPNLYAFTFSVGDSQTTASDVLFDGHFLWVAVQGRYGGMLEKMTETGEILSIVLVGTAPIEMAYDGANVWVSNYDTSSVSIVNSDGELIKTIFLPASAHPEGIFFDGKYVWVANNGVGSNSVSKFEAASKTLIATYPVGSAPDDVAFDGTDIWVTNSHSDNVMKLDRETGEILRTYPTGVFPLSIIFDGKDMWVGNGDIAASNSSPLASASLTKLRAAGGVLLGTFAAGNAVRGLAYDGTSIWACNSDDNTVTRIRASDGAQLGTYPTGKAPRGIAYDGVHMWIANSGENTVTAVSSRSDSVLMPIRPGMGSFVPPVVLTPRLLTPIGTPVAGAQSEVTSITPRVSPAVAALSGILDALLDNN